MTMSPLTDFPLGARVRHTDPDGDTSDGTITYQNGVVRHIHFDFDVRPDPSLSPYSYRTSNNSMVRFTLLSLPTKNPYDLEPIT